MSEEKGKDRFQKTKICDCYCFQRRDNIYFWVKHLAIDLSGYTDVFPDAKLTDCHETCYEGTFNIKGNATYCS